MPIVWKGSAVTDREIVREAQGRRCTAHATASEIVELVRKLASEFDDTQIARPILHRRGHRSGLDLSVHRFRACPRSGTSDRDPILPEEDAAQTAGGDHPSAD